MTKKQIVQYCIILIVFLIILLLLANGAILRHHYLNINNNKYQNLKKISLFFAEIPHSIKTMIKRGTININLPPEGYKHVDKKKFQRFIKKNRGNLLVLPRYDFDQKRSVVDIIDIDNFKVIHTYRHDINDMNSKIKNKKKFSRIHIDKNEKRFYYTHPFILDSGALISSGGLAYKIDICSNLEWLNDEEIFNHSINIDHEKNFWFVTEIDPKSKYIEKFGIDSFIDFAISKITKDGEIIFKKSVLEILIENQFFPENFAYSYYRQNTLNRVEHTPNPVHLNDIEPVLKDTEFFLQGDLLLSLRNLSAIIQYRPSTNKVINYITGPFAEQHDVDIISDKEISIFNNNNFLINDKFSEVLIYNFETKKFRKYFNDQLIKDNFKTSDNGLSQILIDGSLMVEEQNHGRIIFYDKSGKKEWEFVNKSKKGVVGQIKWSRIIENKDLVDKLKFLYSNKKCLN